MVGYKLFLEKLEKLKLSEQYEVLGKIFNTMIFLYELEENNNNIYLRYYDGNGYYRFCFIFGACEEKCLKIKMKERIVLCDVYVDNILRNMEDVVCEQNKFYMFLKILKEGDISYFDCFL